MKRIIATKDNVNVYIVYNYKENKDRTNKRSICICYYGIESDSTKTCNVIFDEIKFPSKIDNVPVEYLSNKGCSLELGFASSFLFLNRKIYIKKLILPESLKSIDQEAFKHSKLIEEIVWPQSCNFIPVGCFSFSFIKKITFNGDIKKIENSAFAFSKLNTIEIPPSCHTIASESFKGCQELRKLTIPNSIKCIGSCAFQNSGLESFIWENRCLNIPYKCFSNSRNLKSIIIESPITYASISFFEECSNLELLDLSKITSLCQVESMQQINEKLKDIPTVKLPFYGCFFE